MLSTARRVQPWAATGCPAAFGRRSRAADGTSSTCGRASDHRRADADDLSEWQGLGLAQGDVCDRLHREPAVGDVVTTEAAERRRMSSGRRRAGCGAARARCPPMGGRGRGLLGEAVLSGTRRGGARASEGSGGGAPLESACGPNWTGGNGCRD
eukprot:7388071-Prymnesium_polylepis.1